METITFNGGRFGNQLYYLLQAYKQNRKYKVTNRNPAYEKDLDKLVDDLKLFGMDDLIDMESSECEYENTYAQWFGVEFTPEELEDFIRNKILKSSYFNEKLNSFGLNDKDICLYIRCGDFLTIPRHNCIDRIMFFDRAFKKIQNKNVRLVVQSDDIAFCKDMYGDIIAENFKDVEWYRCGTVLDDFIHLCSFKNKIILNSTYAIWASFISNVLFDDSYDNIICPNVNFSTDEKNKLANVYNPKWNIVYEKEPIKPFEIKDIDLNRYSLCISLKPVRYERLANAFAKVGLAVPTLIEGERDPIPAIGCDKSHIKAINYAKEHNFPYVVIFEDDAYPCPDVLDQFRIVIDEIIQNNIHFGCLILGRNGEASGWLGNLDRDYHFSLTPEAKYFHTRQGFRTNTNRLSENLMTIPGHLFGSHALIILKDYYDLALSRFQKCDVNPDVSLCYNMLNTIMTRKCLFIQHNDDGTYYYPKYYNEDYSGDIGQYRELPIGFKEL